MKKFAIAAIAATSLATASFAGGNSEAEMEPMVETPEVVAASSSASGLIVPLLAILLLAAVASGGDDADSGGGNDMMYSR